MGAIQKSNQIAQVVFLKVCKVIGLRHNFLCVRVPSQRQENKLALVPLVLCSIGWLIAGWPFWLTGLILSFCHSVHYVQCTSLPLCGQSSEKCLKAPTCQKWKNLFNFPRIALIWIRKLRQRKKSGSLLLHPWIIALKKARQEQIYMTHQI